MLMFNPMSVKQILFMLAKRDYNTTCSLLTKLIGLGVVRLKGTVEASTTVI